MVVIKSYQITRSVYRVDDFFALVDGRLKKLNIFIVDIVYTDEHLSSVYNMIGSYITKYFSQFQLFELSNP